MGYAVTVRGITLAVISVFLLAGCVTRPPGVLVDRGGADISSLSAGDMQLSWRFGEELVYFELGAPTNGWLGIAFGPAPGLGAGALGGANVVVGYVSDGEVVVRDDYGCESYAHCADSSIGGTDDLTEVSGEEVPGWTEIRFAMPREAVDPFDVGMEPGSEMEIVLGHGVLDRLEDNRFARYRIRIRF
ncbi:MAG: DOMON domain-containing protein [Spirochaetaceae bacterium]